MTSKEIAKAIMANDKIIIVTPKTLQILGLVRALMGDN